MGQELVQVVLVGFAGMGGGGTELPCIDRPSDGLAEIAGHLAGKRRDGGNRPRGFFSYLYVRIIHAPSQKSHALPGIGHGSDNSLYPNYKHAKKKTQAKKQG
jgi:hypothetical protein